MLPPALIAYADRLAGLTTNHIRLEPQGARDGVKGNGMIRFTLPANTLVKADSFAVRFTAVASASGSGAARLPPDSASVFDRIEISVGGVQLAAGCNYLHVFRAARRAIMEGPLTQKGTELVMSHGKMIRSKSYITNEVITNTETADLTARDLGGLLSEPIVLDTSLMGDVVVTLHVAGDSVVSTCSANPTTPLIFSANAGFNLERLTLNNIYASIEVMAISDPAYFTLAKRLIQEKGFIEVPFKNIHSSTGSHLGTSRFNVATQSLDRVWVCFRNNANLGDHKPAVPARGYRSSANVSEFPEHTMLERWIPSEFVLSLPDKNATFQLTLNGTQYPQFPSSADGWLAITENSLPPGHKLRSDLFRAEYTDQCAVLCARLNAPGAETVRSISGLDTRGVSLTGQLSTQNNSSSNTHQCMLFSECTESVAAQTKPRRQVAGRRATRSADARQRAGGTCKMATPSGGTSAACRMAARQQLTSAHSNAHLEYDLEQAQNTLQYAHPYRLE
jgi:hypothetical protein